MNRSLKELMTVLPLNAYPDEGVILKELANPILNLKLKEHFMGFISTNPESWPRKKENGRPRMPLGSLEMPRLVVSGEKFQYSIDTSSSWKEDWIERGSSPWQSYTDVLTLAWKTSLFSAVQGTLMMRKVCCSRMFQLCCISGKFPKWSGTLSQVFHSFPSIYWYWIFQYFVPGLLNSCFGSLCIWTEITMAPILTKAHTHTLTSLVGIVVSIITPWSDSSWK